MIITDARQHLYRPFDTDLLPAEAALKLADLGITTLAELRDHWAYGNRLLIREYLGEGALRFVTASPGAMLATRGSTSQPSNVVNLLEAGRPAPLVRHARGVILPESERRTPAAAPAARARATRGGMTLASRLPKPAGRPTVSLVDRFPAVRDQKSRGTCVAFASVAFLEFHLTAQQGAAVARHSEQFVYWACKEDDQIPTDEGTYVRTARNVLKTRGACLHRTWKYNPLPIANNEGQGPAPAGAIEEAKASKWSGVRKLAARNTGALRTALDAGRPVVLSVKTFPNWDFDVVAQTGEISLPFPGSNSDGGHAICLVGYELNPEFPGGGAFLFRNSWGTGWAKKEGRFGPGYGTLYFEYVEKYGLEAFA